MDASVPASNELIGKKGSVTTGNGPRRFDAVGTTPRDWQEASARACCRQVAVTVQTGRVFGGMGRNRTGRTRSNDSGKLKVKSAFGLGFPELLLGSSIPVSSTLFP